jgi:hypothetical protein
VFLDTIPSVVELLALTIAVEVGERRRHRFGTRIASVTRCSHACQLSSSRFVVSMSYQCFSQSATNLYSVPPVNLLPSYKNAREKRSSPSYRTREHAEYVEPLAVALSSSGFTVLLDEQKNLEDYRFRALDLPLTGGLALGLRSLLRAADVAVVLVSNAPQEKSRRQTLKER